MDKIMNYVPTIESLIKQLSINHDVQTIEARGHKFVGVLEKSQVNLLNWLYGVLHAGNQHAREVNSFEIFRNNDLREKILAVTEDPGIEIPANLINCEDTLCVGVIEGVRVSFKKPSSDGIHATIKIPRIRTNLTPGFILYNGLSFSQLQKVQQRRYYIECNDFNFALSFWEPLIEGLKEVAVSFSAKVLSVPSMYPRNDAIVVYINDSSDLTYSVESLLHTINSDIRKSEPIISPSLLISPLIEGIGTAMEPVQKSELETQSFGENRCEAIAKALRDSFLTYISLEDLLTARLTEAKINPQNLSQNLE